jgi:hypothetical protein
MSSQLLEIVPGLIILAILGFLYFIPTLVAWASRNAAPIFFLNIFLGWTVAGWVAALIWALDSEDPALQSLDLMPGASNIRLLPKAARADLTREFRISGYNFNK